MVARIIVEVLRFFRPSLTEAAAGLIGAGIGAGATLAGGGMSSHSARKVARMQLNAQRQFAQHGLRWRVEDAQRAGVHPLYAMGAQLPSFQPIQVDTGAMGEAVASAGRELGAGIGGYLRSRSTEAYQSAIDRAAAAEHENLMRQSAMEVNSAVADKNAAEAAEARSRTLLNTLQINKEHMVGVDPLMSDAFKYQEVQLSSSRKGQPYIAAGPGDVAWRVYHVMPGFDVLAPNAQNFAESMEGIENYGLQAAVMAINTQYYGAEWEQKALQFLPKIVSGSGWRLPGEDAAYRSGARLREKIKSWMR